MQTLARFLPRCHRREDIRRDGPIGLATEAERYWSAILTVMDRWGDQPSGAIFMFEGDYLAVEPDIGRAERYIELYEVADLDAYDERGRRLGSQVVGDGRAARVQVFVRDGEPQ